MDRERRRVRCGHRKTKGLLSITEARKCVLQFHCWTRQRMNACRNFGFCCLTYTAFQFENGASRVVRIDVQGFMRRPLNATTGYRLIVRAFFINALDAAGLTFGIRLRPSQETKGANARRAVWLCGITLYSTSPAW